MQFKPLTEKEIQEANLWAPGFYNFEIAKAEETISKSGNDMIKLTLNVYNDEGRSQMIFDYLLESIPHKLRHLAEACDLLDRYNQGELNSYELEGKRGQCKIIVQKDKTGAYPDKNAVVDYVAEKKAEHVKGQEANGLDDEIPTW